MIDSRVGGPQLRALSVAKKLRNRDIETEFLIPDGDDSFENRAKAEGFEVHRPGLKRVYSPKKVLKNTIYCVSFPLAVKRIRNVIRSQDIDIVHANMSINFESAVASALSNARLVWHFNEVLIPWPVTKIAGMTAMRLADQIVVASDAVHHHYFECTNTETTKLYAPVDVQEFKPGTVNNPGLRDDINIDKNVFLVGAIGHINPIKGHEYLIQAIAHLKQHLNKPVAAVIAGARLESRSEYYKDLLTLRADLGLEDTVKFLGHHDDIPALLSAVDVFVLSSVAEACPMVVLEAMAMKLPVVASNVGGVPEQITDGDSGWLVPSKNPEALAATLTEVALNKEEANRRARNARQTAVEKFSLSRCAQRHETIYRDVIDNPHKGSSGMSSDKKVPGGQ